MYAAEFRWRAVVLHNIYSVPCVRVGQNFGISGRTVIRWYQQFKRCGHAMPGKRAKKTRQLPHVQRFVADHVKVHPCFYVEELQSALQQRFGASTSSFSATALLRLLKFDLGLSRKVLERRAREAVPQEIEDFVAKMKCWYKYSEQLVFVDETSKNSLDSMRRYAWSARGSRAVVRVPFSRGKRVSILAACDVSGFLSWKCTRGTYTRLEFHRAFVSKVIPQLNPWPLPRSIVVIDNARIHMCAELEAAVHACGAILLYLPPYCPQFHPIEVMFGQLKRWLARHANLAFPLYPELVLSVAMRACVKSEDVGVDLFRHCGYGDGGLDDAMFNRELEIYGDRGEGGSGGGGRVGGNAVTERSEGR